MRAGIILFLILVVGVCACGCTGTGTPSTTTQAQATAAVASPAATSVPSGSVSYIRIRDSHFDPEELTVDRGTTVIWTNEDAITHTVTHMAPVGETTLFDSGTLYQGQTFSYTFTTPGRVEYADVKHAGGRNYLIIVK